MALMRFEVLTISSVKYCICNSNFHCGFSTQDFTALLSFLSSRILKSLCFFGQLFLTDFLFIDILTKKNMLKFQTACS